MSIKTIAKLSAPLFFLLPLSVFAGSDTPLPLVTLTPASILEESSTTETQSDPKTFTECSQQAIEDRDTAIAASRSIYNTSMAKVLIERKNHEKAAIAAKSEDEKKSAIKASAELYKNQTKNAQNTLTQARKLAWQTFENDVEECRQINNVDTSSDISKSNQGEDALAPTLKKTDDSETKTITGTIKAQFESFKSLFNKD